MNRKHIILLCILLSISFLAGCSYFMAGSDNVEKNNAGLAKALEKIDGSTFKLGEVTGFEWTTGYFFMPYADKKRIEQTLGIKSNFVLNSINDEEYQLFFVDNNKITAFINGSDYTRFHFIYPTADNVIYRKISPETEFTVKRETEGLIFEISNLSHE